MRIFQVNKFSTMNGGSETVADIVARAGSARGHEVALVGFRKEGQPEVAGAIHLGPEKLTVPGMFRNRRLVEQVVEQARRFRPDAILHHNVYHHFPMAQLVETLEREIGVPQSIILHDHKPVCPAYVGLRSGMPCRDCSGGLGWQAVVHGCKDGSRIKSAFLAADSLWNTRLRDVYSRFRSVIAPSKFLAGNVRGIGGGRPIIALCNPCPDPVRSDAPRQGIVFGSRFVEEKGVELLIRVVESLPEHPFVVAGDGPLREDIARAAARLANLTFVGRLPRSEVGALVGSARYLLLPSIGMENNPMIALEALSRGTPILGSRRGGIPELVEPDRGRLFEPSSLEDVVATVRSAMAAPQSEWTASSEACLTWAASHTESAYIDSLIPLLAPLPASRGPGAPVITSETQDGK